MEAHALEQANALKAAGAPQVFFFFKKHDQNFFQAEVKAAVLNYIALTEDPLVLTPIEVAKKKVRMLKANEASQVGFNHHKQNANLAFRMRSRPQLRLTSLC